MADSDEQDRADDSEAVTSEPADRSSDEGGVRRPAAIREAAMVAAALIALLALGSWWVKRAGRVDPDSSARRVYAQYIGEKSCRECHPGITAQHARAGHSRTLRQAASVPVAGILDGRKAADPEHPGAEFAFHLSDGVLSTTRTAPDSSPERLLLQYALGSGTHAVTFLTLQDGESSSAGALESRLTWFHEGDHGRIGITPGQEADSNTERGVRTPRGRALDPAETLKCLDCHTTVLSDVGPKRFDAETMIPTVTCERCHGPARAHVEAARRGETSLAMPFGAGRETAELEMKLCGHCHRLPEMAPPGAVRVDNHELARFQPVGLMQSACWKGTKGELRCTTCHDPHTRTSNDLVRYENGCLRCHDAAPERICSISPTPKSGCVGCHMPKRDAGQGILFTDHWIRIP